MAGVAGHRQVQGGARAPAPGAAEAPAIPPASPVPPRPARPPAPPERPGQRFEEFYAASYGRLLAQLYAVVGSYDLAEELVQEAFSRALDHWGTLRDYEQPEVWVRRVALNLGSNGLRRARVAARALARQGPPPDVPPVSVDHLALIEGLRALSRRYREVLVLHYMADLTVDEVAAELDVPANTVKTRLARGRRELHRQLTDRDEDGHG